MYMNTNEKISKLRELMKEENMNAYLVGDFDKHGSEYANNYYKERSFMSGFLGSDGTLLVTEDKAYLWTDGRYFLQAEIELKDTVIGLMKMGTEGYPSLIEYIKNSLKGKTIGLNGEYFSTLFIDSIKPFVNVKASKDLVSLIWEDRGELEFSDIWAVDKKL